MALLIASGLCFSIEIPEDVKISQPKNICQYVASKFCFSGKTTRHLRSGDLIIFLNGDIFRLGTTWTPVCSENIPVY